MDTKNLLLVGISGKKGHGKDTFAEGIDKALQTLMQQQRRLRWQTLHFADPLKDEVARLVSGIVLRDARSNLFPEAGSGLEQQLHWEGCQEDMFPGVREALDDVDQKEQYRLLMQWYGTEFRRKQYADDYWVRQVEAYATKWQGFFNEGTPLVLLLPDMRFPNEAEWVRRNGGYLIRVNRDGVEQANDPHPSEIALDQYPHFDLTYTNETHEDWKTRIAQDASIATGFMVDWKWRGRL